MKGMFSRISLGGTRKKPIPLRGMPLVSVVIPCYNYGRYLQACVDSVRNNQPPIALDIVIIDDCSTDDSLAIAHQLREQDPRVRVIAHKVNKGHIQTYNDGLAAATGEYVLLLSADDLVAPGALTRAAALLDAESGVGLVYGGSIDFRDKVPTGRTGKPSWIVWKGRDWLRARCRSGYNVVPTPSAVMRTAVLRQIGGYRADLPHAGDFEMWLRTAVQWDIGFLAGVDQAFYRCHGTNMHASVFHSGTADGQFVDMQQRLQSFEAVFSRTDLWPLQESAELLQIARRTLATQAIGHVNYAYARGKRHFPCDDFEAFARRVDPGIDLSRAGRALARRKRFGLVDTPLHPLWAPSAIAGRAWEQVRRFRHYSLGV